MIVCDACKKEIAKLKTSLKLIQITLLINEVTFFILSLLLSKLLKQL